MSRAPPQRAAKSSRTAESFYSMGAGRWCRLSRLVSDTRHLCRRYGTEIYLHNQSETNSAGAQNNVTVIYDDLINTYHSGPIVNLSYRNQK